MYVTDWAAAQREDPVLDAVLHWLEAKKKTDLRTLWGIMLPVRRAKLCGRIIKFHDSAECPLSTLHTQRGE